MRLTRAEVEHVAHLSRLDLSDQAIDKMTSQLSHILDYIAKLNELDTAKVEPMSHPSDLRDVLREDEPSPSLDREDALANAPDELDGFFKVPKVIE